MKIKKESFGKVTLNSEAIAEKRTFDETMKEQMVLEACSTSFAGASSNPILDYMYQKTQNNTKYRKRYEKIG